MAKHIIPDDEIWASKGELTKPSKEHFLEGHSTGVDGRKPKHDEFNFLDNRRDVNQQAILREGVTAWDSEEIYPIGATTRVGEFFYTSKVDNNQGNIPTLDTKNWTVFKSGDSALLEGSTKADIMTEVQDYFTSMMDSIFPIGSKLFGASNPSSRGLVGTWEAMEADITIGTVAQGDPKIGTIDGENNPQAVIPFTQIKAAAISSFSGIRQTGRFQVGHDAPIQLGLADGVFTASNPTNADRHGGDLSWGMSVVNFSMTPTGTVKTDVTVDSIGTHNATNNVRGRRYHDVIWIRTA